MFCIYDFFAKKYLNINYILKMYTVIDDYS